MKSNKHIESADSRRFKFGKNWKNFLSALNPEQVIEAENSLTEMLDCMDLNGKSFLDIGSGSGLSSLVARRLGAKVHSFDYDPQSVECTAELKKNHFPEDPHWTIEKGSALDRDYLESLGPFSIVYSWGVLHHTGDMWKALSNAEIPVDEGGLLFIAIYNDQGTVSRFWTVVKKIYNSGFLGKLSTILIFFPYFFSLSMASGLIKYRNPMKYFSEYKKKRGMSVTHDWIDWLGGYPFEVAKPEEIFSFFQKRGFQLQKFSTTNRQGCNQFIFKKMDL